MVCQVLHVEGIYSEEYDPKAADIWTCGVMLYVFTTACLPFDSENNATLYRCLSSWLGGVAGFLPSHSTVCVSQREGGPGDVSHAARANTGTMSKGNDGMMRTQGWCGLR